MTEEPGHAVGRLRAALAGYGQTGDPEYLDLGYSLERTSCEQTAR